MLGIKTSFLILFIANCLKSLKAEDIIDCSNDELVTSVFNEPIDLTLNGTIKIYENVLINDIISTSNNEFEVKYIDARLENTTLTEPGDANVTMKNLVIFTTEHFQNYAREQTAARISLKINLGCGSGKERILVFFQPLKEGNYYSPIFSQSRYELLMPTPIFAGFDLTALMEISAKDDDLTLNQINFTSITSFEHHIHVGTKNVTSSDKKTYFANVTLDRIYLELPQQIEFVITATDNGIPPRSSNATIVLRSDPAKHMPVKPRFTQELYRGTINLDFTMTPIHVELLRGSYSPEVNFILSGNDTEAFEIINPKTGKIEIQWNAWIVDQSFIMQHRKWELQLIAEHSQLAEFSVATILVELADFQSFFHFMSTYYDGTIDDQGQIQIMPIVFYPLMYKPDIEFSLMENPQNMFRVTNEGFQVHIDVMANFTLAAFASETFIKLTIRASWEQLSAITYVILKLPEKPLTDHHQQQQMFQFEKPLYVGNFTEAHSLELETISLQTDANATQLREFHLSGQWSYLFHLSVVNGSRQVELEVNLTEIPKEDKQLTAPIILLLEAMQANSATYCTIVLEMAKDEKVVPTATSIFMAHSLIGKLEVVNGNQSISVEPIELQAVQNLKDYEFSIDGVVASNFVLKMDLEAYKLELHLNEPISNATLDLKKIIMLYVHAKLVGSENNEDSLAIFLELPAKECPMPPTPLANPPRFSSSNYIFTTFTNTTGSLGVVRAYSSAMNALFYYTLEVESDTLAHRLSVEPFSGELMLYGSIDVGSYSFNVSAENIETHERAHVQAVLKVTEKEECRIFEGVAVEKTLVIKHLDEEMPHYGIWDMQFNENCSFRLVEMWPKERDYVYVNESSHQLDILPVDREDPIFEDMAEAQILVKLKLLCGQQNKLEEDTVTQTSRSLDFVDRIYSQDIFYSPDTMWLHLIIDDINDNAPQFKLKYSLDYFAYPSGEASLDVYPEYLTKIEATDDDSGLNAKIRYSLRYNAFFDIEPETGIIYPKGKPLQPQQQTELIVLATDQDGEGLIAGTVIIVKGLSSDYYSLITLRENSTKSLDEITQELREKLRYAIRVLKMSYVPQLEARSGDDSAGLVCKAWIYAYRDQKLVQCKELQEKLLQSTVPDASIVNIESYKEAALQSGIATTTAASPIGYIVAVSILSVVSASSIIFIIWRFYYNKMSTSCEQLEQQQHHGNGQHNAREGSHGAADNHPANHVKFSNLIENVTIEECPK